MAVTRNCADIGISGVPVGAQIAWPLCTSKGCPLERTLVVPVIHCAVTHGPLAAGGSAHPATTYGADRITVGCPLTSTLGLGAVGWA